MKARKKSPCTNLSTFNLILIVFQYIKYIHNILNIYYDTVRYLNNLRYTRISISIFLRKNEYVQGKEVRVSNKHKKKTKIRQNKVPKGINSNGLVTEQEYINYIDRSYSVKSIKGYLKHFYVLKEIAERTGNADMCCIVFDLEEAISKLDITTREQNLFDDYLKGYNFPELGLRYQCSKVNAFYIIDKIVRQMERTLRGLDEG